MARLVYSSGPDGVGDALPERCSSCGSEPCRCQRSRAPRSAAVRVRRERSGRRGKTVTVAAPLGPGRDAATVLLQLLKRRCGSGGTLKPLEQSGAGAAGFSIEIQGDHVDRVIAALEAEGYRPKREGG